MMMMIIVLIMKMIFRLNYLVHELAPLGYHLANIALHALVTLLYHQVIIIIMMLMIMMMIPKKSECLICQLLSIVCSLHLHLSLLLLLA